MQEVVFHATNAPKGPDGEQVLVHWALTKDTRGAPAIATRFVRKSVQVSGTLDGATLAIEGSLDEGLLGWHRLEGVDGMPLTFTTCGLWTVPAAVVAIRPVCVGGIDPKVDVALLLVRGT